MLMLLIQSLISLKVGRPAAPPSRRFPACYGAPEGLGRHPEGQFLKGGRGNLRLEVGSKVDYIDRKARDSTYECQSPSQKRNNNSLFDYQHNNTQLGRAMAEN